MAFSSFKNALLCIAAGASAKAALKFTEAAKTQQNTTVAVQDVQLHSNI